MSAAQSTKTADKKPTIIETLGSLTGYDEIAITRSFQADIYGLLDEGGSAMTGTRALIFVLKRREGLKDLEAYEAVMNLSARQVNDDFFDPEPEEVDEDSPETDTGKGSTPSA